MGEWHSVKRFVGKSLFSGLAWYPSSTPRRGGFPSALHKPRRGAGNATFLGLAQFLRLIPAHHWRVHGTEDHKSSRRGQVPCSGPMFFCVSSQVTGMCGRGRNQQLNRTTARRRPADGPHDALGDLAEGRSVIATRCCEELIRDDGGAFVAL